VSHSSQKREGRRARLLFCIAGLAVGAFEEVHFSADGDDGNDKKQHDEAHPGFLKELGLGAARAAAEHFGGQFRSPEEDFGSDDEHGRRL
jgi:hypothetical protein